MEVLRITPRGYCHGVVDAFRIAKRVRESTGGPVDVLGKLVHTSHATDELQEQGIALVDPPNRLAGLELIDEGTVIFTAHGVSPQVKARATEKGLTAVDATCSDVVRTHDLVRDLAAKGYDVVYVGMRGHPEPAGGAVPSGAGAGGGGGGAPPEPRASRSPARPPSRCGTRRP